MTLYYRSGNGNQATEWRLVTNAHHLFLKSRGWSEGETGSWQDGDDWIEVADQKPE